MVEIFYKYVRFDDIYPSSCIYSHFGCYSGVLDNDQVTRMVQVMSKRSMTYQRGFNHEIAGKGIVQCFLQVFLHIYLPQNLSQHLSIMTVSQISNRVNLMIQLKSWFSLKISLGVCTDNPCIKVQRHLLDWIGQTFRQFIEHLRLSFSQNLYQ